VLKVEVDKKKNLIHEIKIISQKANWKHITQLNSQNNLILENQIEKKT
jgi:hypothetical protein